LRGIPTDGFVTEHGSRLGDPYREAFERQRFHANLAQRIAHETMTIVAWFQRNIGDKRKIRTRSEAAARLEGSRTASAIEDYRDSWSQTAGPVRQGVRDLGSSIAGS
jgi:hypothetical protein